MIASPGEIDRYQFSVADAGTHAVETHGPTDVVMYLAGPDNPQRLIAVNDDGGEGRNARLAVFLPAATYYVYVVHYSAEASGPYEILVVWS